jgi:hypothetical protein
MLNPDDPAFAAVPTPVPPTAVAASSPIRTWVLALAAGLVAGGVAWGIGEATLIPEAGFQDKAKKIDISPTVAGLRNSLISFGALGAALGLGLGLAGGLIGRSVPRAILAGLIGLLLGGGAGAGLTRVLLPIYYDHLREGELTYSLMVHCGVWGAAGAAAGLAFALGLVGWRGAVRGVIGGAAGALLGAVIYEVAGGIYFPRALTDRPISLTAETRLMARLLVTALVAAAAVVTLDSTRGAKVAAEPKP